MQHQETQPAASDNKEAIDDVQFMRPWNTKQAASFLGISQRHAYELAREGILPAMKRGRRWYFSPRKLREWAGV